MIITQTKAMLVDAYRELNARKLFWITMGLNILVVAVFASLGINEEGPTFWHWTFDNRFVNTDTISPELFYKLQFVTWGTPFWLSWVATILALISTAGIIPDLVAGGSIETMISKPISRIRLFLTKYIFGLGFATLQVTVFSTGCFLVMWIRGGTTEFGLFMAIPLVVLFFSYLFAVCALLGLITRSTVASLLITLLLWFVVFAVNATDALLLQQKAQYLVEVETLETRLANQNNRTDQGIAEMLEKGDPIEDNEGTPITDPEDQRQAVFPMITRTRTDLERAEKGLDTWTIWTDRVLLMKTILPKTGETIGLLDRYLVTADELAVLMARDNGFEIDEDELPSERGPGAPDPRVQQRMQEEIRGRGVPWILGTSLAFEAIVLALCGFIFARRDF